MPFIIDNTNKYPIVIPDATEQFAGLMSAADKVKLDGLTPGGSTTLQQAYTNGAAGANQTITLSAANGGILVDAAGHLSGLDGVNNIFSAIDSTVLDPTGNANGIRVTRFGELLGSFETSVRQRIMLYGGNTTSPVDVAIRIAPAVSTALPAGILIVGAQDAVPGSTQSGGPVYIVNGLGGGLVGGINGPIILGQAGIENSGGADDAHAPYIFIDGPPNAGNPVSGNGIALRSKPGSASVPAVNISSVTRFVAGSTAPMVRFFEGVLGGAGRNMVEIWGDPTQTMIVYGSYASGIGPLIVRDDATDVSNVGCGVTLDARTAGGHQWDVLARGSGAAGIVGGFSIYDTNVGGVAGERLQITATGDVRPGQTNQGNLGDSTHAWASFSVFGTIVFYNQETTAGVGVPYLEAVSQDIASTGEGVQATGVVQFIPNVSGLYRVSIVASVVTGDTVSVQLTYHDGVNAAAQTTLPISAVVIAGNGTAQAQVFIRANTAAKILVRITLSSQVGTKVSSTIERLN